MRNMQMATPGLPVPGNNPSMTATGHVERHPGLPAPLHVSDSTFGQRMEAAYQDVGNLFTAFAAGHDLIKWVGLERMLSGVPTPIEAGTRAGQAVNKAMREWFVQDAAGNQYRYPERR